MLPTQFVLHVDGVGSFLVLRQPVITIGPISSAMPADVAVVAEPTLPPTTIARIDDDYFLKGGATTPSLGRLLASGQRLDLSPRCRMTFLLPSPASTTAVLDLCGARLARADIRRVILMDQDLIIGPGSASHVVAPQLERPLVLHLSQGQLVCQSREGFIPIGESISAGGVSFVLAPVDRQQGSR
jgi:hypothetical protein